jgi:predicted nucleic acid-binding protein
MDRGDPQPVERARDLLGAVERERAGAFLADSAPIIYRLERAASSRLVAACDPLFDSVDRGGLACIVSAVTVAEVLVKPFRTGPAAVAAVDAFFRRPGVVVADVDYEAATNAAELVARAVRLPDALIGATAARFGLPIVTGDRRLARALPNALLVADFA